ncbi:MAG: glycoside hydrolase family 2 protein [Kofleriaceae bacterium]
MGSDVMTRIRLEHGWEVAIASAGSHADPSDLAGLAWRPAKVPGTIASALGEDRDCDGDDVWWRAPLGAELTAGCVLGFDGIATLWDAWVDGVHVASGESMWARAEVRLEHVARQLVIRCRSLTAELAKKRPRPRWKVPMLEQQQLRWIRTTLLGRTPGWSPPCPAVGPWRPVWLEQRVHELGDVRIAARVVGDTGAVEVSLGAVPLADRISVIVERGEQRATAELGHTAEGWSGVVTLADVVRWWPHTHGEPALYAVALAIHHGAHRDRVELGRIGFRTLEVEGYQVRVNGVPVFCRGACWTPLDARALSATPAQYDAAVAQLCAAGMNMVRIGGTMTYEDDALYDALDARGVLLWHDLMFANMDYPEDATFVATVRAEVDAEIARIASRPSLAIVCGNSEGEQQAAMWGAPRERWAPPLFHTILPEVVHARAPGVAYVPSSATSDLGDGGGEFPHASNAGPSSYYGVGAYLRPLEDARRAEVVFASECLAFANIPAPSGLPGDGVRAHHALWKRRAPRDLGAGWDFDDVRDHYVKLLFGVDPVQLRAFDHERYLELGRHATGEVMARTFGEWRRARSVTRGGLVWFLRDLWPGAGWGVVDAHGRPKLAWYALRRALAPVALAISDEGTNGLAVHVVNDGAAEVTRVLELVLWRGDAEVGRGSREVAVPARGAIELGANALFDGFFDLSYAYRFGPPGVHVIHARFGEAEQFWFPAGLSAARGLDVGLSAQLDGDVLTVSAQRFAQFVTIDAPGWLPSDDGFHLAPGQRRAIAMTHTGGPIKPGTITAINAEATAKIVTST